MKTTTQEKGFVEAWNAEMDMENFKAVLHKMRALRLANCNDSYNELIQIKSAMHQLECFTMLDTFRKLEIANGLDIPWLEEGLGA